MKTKNKKKEGTRANRVEMKKIIKEKTRAKRRIVKLNKGKIRKKRGQNAIQHIILMLIMYLQMLEHSMDAQADKQRAKGRINAKPGKKSRSSDRQDARIPLKKSSPKSQTNGSAKTRIYPKTPNKKALRRKSRKALAERTGKIRKASLA